jgi:hypothetical protein
MYGVYGVYDHRMRDIYASKYLCNDERLRETSEIVSRYFALSRGPASVKESVSCR